MGNKMSGDEIIFVGAFDSPEDPGSRATSPAGNQVQAEIMDAFRKVGLKDNLTFKAISAKPIRTWPYGPFLWRGLRSSDFFFPRFVNLVFIRRLMFSFSLFLFLRRRTPKIVAAYNPGIGECIAMLLFRMANPDSVFLVGIVQDIHFSRKTPFKLIGAFDFFSMKLIRFFDLALPISAKIVDDFGLDRKKVIVFNGGFTRQGRELLSADALSYPGYAVFAGAVEKYNGIEVLVKKWMSTDVNMDLHIFGRGSSDPFVKEASIRDSRIVVHGFQSEEVVTKWQGKALVNFCLRYSEGIEAGYFFPSKFFNVICAPGAVVANRFEGFPEGLEETCFMISDDLNELPDLLNSIKNSSELSSLRGKRNSWLRKHASWENVTQSIFKRKRELAGGA